MDANDIIGNRMVFLEHFRKAHSRLGDKWPGVKMEQLTNIYWTIAGDLSSYMGYSQDDPGMISYAKSFEDRYVSKKRIKTSLGRYIRRQLKIDKKILSDLELQTLTRIMFAFRAPVGDLVSVFRGDAITDAYRRGVGLQTCMTQDKADYVRVYARNPDIVAIVIYGDDEARALLWTCTDGTMVLDRIYPNDGQHVQVLWKWATEMGYLHRGNNSAPCSGDSIQLSDGSVRSVRLSMVGGIAFLPYLDTFPYGVFENNNKDLALSNRREKSFLTFHSTRGLHFIPCDKCDYWRGEERWEGKQLCSACMSEFVLRCDHCGGLRPRSQVHTRFNGSVTCDRCYRDQYVVCHICRRQVFIFDERIYYDTALGASYCLECAKKQGFICASCNRELRRDPTSTHFIVSDVPENCEIYCRRCRWICEDCNEVQVTPRNATIYPRCDQCREGRRNEEEVQSSAAP